MYEGTKIDLRVFVVYNVRVHVQYSTFESTFESTFVLSKIEYFRTCNDYTRTCTNT